MFAAIFNTDGRPIDPRPIGPAGHDVEVLGSARRVAFVCTKVDPALSEIGACGIRNLDGRYWIVGRIRLDARDDLRARLADRIGSGPDVLTDAQLCLHAYAAWGDGFLDRLAGDFCFVLWDGARDRLVCARDQLGVRSLFHAEAGGAWFIGDSLDWIATSASVGRDLDDAWIADFLSVGHCLEFERTVYRRIRRLAPAHVLTLSDSGADLRRYWRLDIAEPLYYSDRRRYFEQLVDLLSKSTRDRLPAGKVGISMSGGLDSTTLAAFAVQVTGDPSRVVAECGYFERLMPDDEHHFSALVARQLGIELQLRPIDDLDYDPQWRSRSIRTAEPTTSIMSAYHDRAIGREQAGRAQVWFEGEGPDNALPFERNAYLSWLVGRRDWRRLGEAVLQYVAAKGLSGWMATLRRYTRRRTEPDDSFDIPPWLDRSLVDRLDLEGRLAGTGVAAAPPHPWHPRAFASFNDPIWSAVFTDHDLEEALAPLVWRHPFLDLRVLEFMLSVPPVPWGREKLLLREAMRGRLPPEVLARKKVSFPALPIADLLRTGGLPGLSPGGRLAEYVDVRTLPVGPAIDSDLDRVLAVHVLDHWLDQRFP